MKSPDEIQGALDHLAGIKKNPALLKLLAPSPVFQDHIPGVVAALRWVLSAEDKSLGEFHAEICRDSGPRAGDSKRGRPASQPS